MTNAIYPRSWRVGASPADRVTRMLQRVLRVFVIPLITIVFAAPIFGQAFCAPPKTMPKDPPPPPPPPVCQPKVCEKCTASPCYVDSGIYVSDPVDLTIPTSGFPLVVSRHYDSSVTVDGPLGVGWTSSLMPHLFYATYLYATNVYQYEADVVMPDGARYRFSDVGNGTFAPPTGRRDALVRNPNGTFTMTLQQSRSVYAFAADGSLTSMIDDFGNTIAFTYDAAGRVQTVSDMSGSGRSLTVTWNPQGRMADISDSASPARHFTYNYNSDGTLAGVRDPVTPSGKQSTTYAYTAGRYGPVLAEIKDRWSRSVTRLSWQSDGKLASYTDGDFVDANPTTSTGEKYTYSYGGGITNKQSSLGIVSHSYATGGLITDHADYDASGNVTSALDGTNFWRTWYQYNTRGNVAVVTRYVPSDAAHMCCTMLGNWNYTYDSDYPDQVSAITPTTQEGNAMTTFPAWVYEYNSTSETAPGAIKRVKRYNTSRTATETMATYTYDAKGHILTATDNLGRTSSFAYDAAGNTVSATVAGRTTTYGYDSVGRVISSTDAAGHMTAYTYDALNRALTVTLPRPSATQALTFVTSFSYDNEDDGVIYMNVTDANGRVTKIGRDVLNHVVRVVDTLGNVTQYSYQYNLLKSITDANGNKTSYGYDANRNVTSVTLPDGGTESYQRGWDGTLITSTDRRGTTTEYQYDGLGRVWHINYSSAGTALSNTDFNFDGEVLASVTSGPLTGRTTTTFNHDTFWRVSSEVQDGYTVAYQYTVGVPALMSGYTVTPATGQTWSARTVGYSFDPYLRINGITWSAISGSFVIEYNALGQYSRITYPNGVSREYTYDDQGRLTSLANRANGDNIATFQYGYDYDGGGGATLLGQRTSVTMTGPATINSRTDYAYDGNYQLIRATTGSAVQSWQYDAIGNRVFASYPWTYYKNGTNALNGQRLRSDGGADITYDANGNVTGRVGQSWYVWDYANRLSSAPFSNTSYTYDYTGRRTSANWGGQITKYLSQGMNTIGERVGTTTTRDYLFAPGIDEPLAMVDNGQANFYSVDGLGSIVATTDSSASIASAAYYDAWGGATYLRAPNTTGLFGYTGRENDNAGLLFYRARWYSPAWGRFVGEDPIRQGVVAALTQDPTTFVRNFPDYAYVYNRPSSLRDPLGLDPFQGRVNCVNDCIDSLREDTFKCLRTFTYSELGCITGFSACVALSSGVATPACLIGLTACETWAFLGVTTCRYDATVSYGKCLKKCDCKPSR